MLMEIRGSWQERQLYDREPFTLRHTDRRAKVQFYLPLLFYLLAWLVGFSTIHMFVKEYAHEMQELLHEHTS